MLSKNRRVTGTIALTLSLALFAGACGDDGDDTGSAVTTTAGGAPATTVAGAPGTTEAPGEEMTPVAGTLDASGATFPKGFYEVVIAEFANDNPDAALTYAGGGSGKGRTDLQEQVVDWAGTDGLVKDEDYEKFSGGDFLYFPTVIAPITVSYNLDGVDELKLSPDTIAKIFQRDITEWDDAAIKAENPDAGDDLSGPITVAHRSDGSGTTENFTIFLEQAAGPDATGVWKLKTGSTVEWPSDTQAGNGNAGVGQIVKDTSGAIGYVDLSDAKAIGLQTASIKNKAGKYVEPTLEGASEAAAGAVINDDLSYSPLWADGDAAYPITAPTWIIAYVKQTDKEKGETLKAFLHYLLTDGQELANSVDYGKLPAGLDEKALAQLDKLEIPA